jgi:thiol peroxidase
MKLFITACMLTAITLSAATNETVTLSGNKVKLTGNKVSVGNKAPAVKVITSDLKEVTIGGNTKQTQVLLVVPSIDTPVCDAEARHFNEQASKLKDVQITVISMDLPFAGQRYCAAHGIKNITVASDFQTKEFGKSYGTLIADSILKGIETRAIFVIKNGKVTYKQLVPEITQAPDYEAVLKAI